MSTTQPPSLCIHRRPVWLYPSARSRALPTELPAPRIMRRFEKPFSHNSINQFSSPVGLSEIALISPLGGGVCGQQGRQWHLSGRTCWAGPAASGAQPGALEAEGNSFVLAASQTKPRGEKTITSQPQCWDSWNGNQLSLEGNSGCPLVPWVAKD